MRLGGDKRDISNEEAKENLIVVGEIIDEIESFLEGGSVQSTGRHN